MAKKAVGLLFIMLLLCINCIVKAEPSASTTIAETHTIDYVGNKIYEDGALFAESTNGDVQPYKYNGKELDRMHGLDWYDHGARHNDAAIGRWHVMDPLCEKYYDISPYAYCHNNPIMLIDLDGMKDYTFNKDGYFYDSTSVWEKFLSFFGFGRGEDRIFMEGNNNPVLVFDEGSITNLTNNNKLTKFEISSLDDAQNLFQLLINQTDVEWAHIRHSPIGNDTYSSTLINNHSDKVVSSSTLYSKKYINNNEHNSLFEHSHPLDKDYKENGIPNLPFLYPPSKEDIRTAGNYPYTIFRVYDIYNKKKYEYDKKGIRKVW